MYCPKCGHKCKNNQKFCSKCGNRLGNENDYSQNNVDVAEKQQTYDTNISQNTSQKEIVYKYLEKRGSNLKVYFLIGSLLFLIISIFCIIFSVKTQNNDTKELYQNFINNPKTIPELSQPKSLDSFIANLADVQQFLYLYLKYSDENMDKKLKVFNAYREQLLKVRSFNNNNLLQKDFHACLNPKNQHDIAVCQKQYDNILKVVGLKIKFERDNKSFYIEEDPTFTLKKYGDLLPIDWYRYLQLRSDTASYFNSNIPDKLAYLIHRYEVFYMEYPEFISKKEVENVLYSAVYLYALGSSKYVNDKTTLKNYQKSYMKFCKKYPNSSFINIVSEAQNNITSDIFEKLYKLPHNAAYPECFADNTPFDDIFSELRQYLLINKTSVSFNYIYSMSKDKWIEYKKNYKLTKDSYLISENTGDGTCALKSFDIYTHNLVKLDNELELGCAATVFLKNDKLYFFEPNKFTISEVNYTKDKFVSKTLTIKEVKNLFTNYKVIDCNSNDNGAIDIYQNKKTQAYMLYNCGYNYNYQLSSSSSNFRLGELDNMFIVSNNDLSVIFAFWGDENNCNDEYKCVYINVMPPLYTEPDISENYLSTKKKKTKAVTNMNTKNSQNALKIQKIPQYSAEDTKNNERNVAENVLF